MPDEEPIELWIVDGRISREPVGGADTIFDGGWILPGLVDAHCHVGLGPQGGVELDEAIAQAETEREVGALLLRDCGSPIDTRSLDDRDDLPRIIRAGRHLARPKRYIPGLADRHRRRITTAGCGGRAGTTRRRLGQAGRRLDRPRQ